MVRLSAEAVLREAWSLARIEVQDRAREAYGNFAGDECGYRIEATVQEAIKGPSGSLTLLTHDPLEPGKQYLIASRRIERDSVGGDPEPFIACRVRHELHGNRYAPIELADGSLYLVDPRGSLVPAGRHPDAPDRAPILWADARSRIEEVLATDGPYPPTASCPDGTRAELKGSRGNGDGSELHPYYVTYYAVCEGTGWYSKEGESAPWEFVEEDVPEFVK